MDVPKPRPWRPAVVFAAAAVACGLLGVRPASADTSNVADGRDADGGPDIASVSAGHVPDGRFRYRIDTHARFDRSAAPCLMVKAGLHLVRYRVCGRGTVVRLANGAISGHAKVTRPNRTSIVYTFGPRAIGSPSFHRWRVVDPGRHCPHDVCDEAPNSGYVTHKRRMTYVQWADKFLRELRVPRCDNNEIVVVAWETNEGTDAVWNPLATTYWLKGSTRFNSHGVRNYESLAQGLNGTRLTIERGFSIYGYGAIVRKLDNCASPMETARAIKRSSWCGGCSNGRYVTGLIRTVKRNFATYRAREIATAL